MIVNNTLVAIALIKLKSRRNDAVMQNDGTGTPNTDIAFTLQLRELRKLQVGRPAPQQSDRVP